jgi:hypothetical protein
MTGISRLMTSAAAVGGLVFVVASSGAHAERATPRPSNNGSALAGPVASLSAGSIHGVVQDENGVPLKGAVVTARGATISFTVSDGTGRFELRTLSPGS